MFGWELLLSYLKPNGCRLISTSSTVMPPDLGYLPFASVKVQ